MNIAFAQTRSGAFGQDAGGGQGVLGPARDGHRLESQLAAISAEGPRCLA
jgi:hypothetical protein